jgi:hypothetical protein
MILYDNIKFQSGKIKFDLKLNGDINCIDGDSAIGKTFMINELKIAVDNGKVCNESKPIVFVKNQSLYDKLDISIYTNSLIIIDNFDEVVQNTPQLLEQININSNQYIIVNRACYPQLQIPLQNCATLYMKDDTIRLVYFNPDFHGELIV